MAIQVPVAALGSLGAAAVAQQTAPQVVPALSELAPELPSTTPVEAAPEVAQPVAVVEPAAQAAVAPQAAAPVNPEADPESPIVKLAKKIDAKKAQYIKLGEEILKLEQQFNVIDKLMAVKAGAVIVARVGRAETSKEVLAQVLGITTLENGDRRLKIFYGDGADAEVAVIQDSQIVDVRTI